MSYIYHFLSLGPTIILSRDIPVCVKHDV